MPNLLTSTLVIFTLVVAAMAAWIYAAYQGDVAAHRERLRGASQVIKTAAGAAEYSESGSGAPLLVVHGAGGGFDQGMELGEALAARGFRVVSMSRFGYLRTPLPSDPSPAVQADAHAALMDALGIQRAAIIGVSAGAPSSLLFAIRHPERCAALVLMVPMAYRPHDIAVAVPRMTPLTEKLLMTMVGSDFVFWFGSRFARNLMIKVVLGTPPEAVRGASAAERARIQRILDNILLLAFVRKESSTTPGFQTRLHLSI
jgi:pimeloyl-ACP methyl ester carboxylesterase